MFEIKNTFLENIRAKKTYIEKSTMTSGNKYKITLTYNKKTISFFYNDNYLNKSDLNDFLYSLLMDSYAYEFCDSVEAFAREYGYKNESEAKKVYNACKKQYERINKLFTKEEKRFLERFYRNY